MGAPGKNVGEAPFNFDQDDCGLSRRALPSAIRIQASISQPTSVLPVTDPEQRCSRGLVRLETLL